ncbi:MoaD/ThiS family protein [Candidatus Woesearchaeota archaeon]|nr:MoaD/ThiS family protein [Candidatus Woesearchaeota archaeon]
MKIYIERNKENKEFDFKGSVQDLLDTLNILSETVLVVKNGTIITEDEELINDDEIKILSVVSGG